MGPKTLCNACGVRYKSGRLVPEYRPAASPTFVLTKHSNSHRKVLELRRQKEMQRAQQQQQQQFLHHHHHHHHQTMMFDVSNGDDYLIHQHIGPDFRQLI
ncbi:GATA transcription factor 12 [Sesamum angolense]|uniref:GATA transcription factor 12 n=1 Tax=Sesamum angolense TaxID=2727404 RepID=A0AAE1WXE1_9LAMI|nr:GATA transcription factor 12 [Sesamum angolense]